VLRVVIDGGLSQAGLWQAELAEPEAFDLSLLLGMVREEVASDPDLGIRNREASSKKTQEEDNHRRVGVDELRVPVSRSFCPIEHAAGCVKNVALTSRDPADALSLVMSCERPGGVRLGALHSPAARSATEILMLLVRQIDIAHPQTDRRARDTKQRGQFLHRTTLFASKPSRLLPLCRFHVRQQRIDSVG
jgi:hypothetical protein